MKVRNLGIEWGPAFEEAQPVRVSHAGIAFTVFVSESGELVIRTEAGTCWQAGADTDGRARIVLS